MNTLELLKCPLCGTSLTKEGKSLFCGGVRRHCFDISAAGYVNFALSNAAGGGDDATLIAARTAFLSSGAYAPIAGEICALLSKHVPHGTVVDAGCGEGYYTLEMARAGFEVLGFDLSKNGIKHAARASRAAGAQAFFAVGGIFDLPLQDASVDAVVSLFAPVAEQEFLRVLKPNGILLLAGAGEEHLMDLKRVLYDTPYPNKPRADAPQSMALIEERTLRFTMPLSREALQALFAMTPYYYRTPRAGKARLDALDALDVGAAVDLAVYQKQSKNAHG